MKEGMSLIVKTITRWVVGFIFLYGIYTVAFCHLHPGGGFAGGVILACAYILITLAYGRRFATRNLDWRIARLLTGISGLIFLGLALLGLIFPSQGESYFFANWIQKNLPGKPFHLFNGGIIPLGNLALALLVLSTIFLSFILLSAVRHFDAYGNKVFHSIEDRE